MEEVLDDEELEQMRKEELDAEQAEAHRAQVHTPGVFVYLLHTLYLRPMHFHTLTNPWTRPYRLGVSAHSDKDAVKADRGINLVLCNNRLIGSLKIGLRIWPGRRRRQRPDLGRRRTARPCSRRQASRQTTCLVMRMRTPWTLPQTCPSSTTLSRCTSAAYCQTA